MAEILEQISIWIEQIITAIGYPGITLVMFLENIFPPIPSELVMPFAGFLVAKDGVFTLPGILLAGTVGAVLGALALYYIGLWAGEPLLRAFLRRYGRWFLLAEDDLDRALATFNRYGQAVIFFGRLIPIIRSLISIPAGMHRMPLPTFLLFTSLGALTWNTVLSLAGMFLGEHWGRVLVYVKQYERLVLVVLVVAVVVFFYKRISARRHMVRLPQETE